MQDRLNSVVFENSEKQHIINLTSVGTLRTEDTEIRITQEKHFFQEGDAIFFDLKNNRFSKAIAINNINSEVCGVVSEVPNENEFVILTEGFLKTDRYSYAIGAPLYLSEVIPGFLMSANPTTTLKQVAVQKQDGIQIDIQIGYFLKENTIKVSLEPYTKEELDDIILNVRG